MRSVLLLLSIFHASFAMADEAAPELSIEINAAQAHQQGCQLSFLIENKLGVDVDQAVYETVLFDTEGAVSQMTLFDFGKLPQNRARVRQFLLAGNACTDLGSILFNGAATCSGTDLPETLCDTALRTSSRVDIKVAG